MGEVMPRVFQDKKDGNLVRHRPQGRKRDGSGKSKKLGHGMEEPSYFYYQL
jgi:hypothetical protein